MARILVCHDLTNLANISPPYRDYAMRRHGPYSEGTENLETIDIRTPSDPISTTH